MKLAIDKQECPAIAHFFIRPKWEGGTISKSELLDHMLLMLWDALFLSQSLNWTRLGVANTPSDEALELARWYLRGQTIGSTPIFDGICAQCGCLLHGHQNQHLVNGFEMRHLL